jgi:hypothetical protein
MIDTPARIGEGVWLQSVFFWQPNLFNPLKQSMSYEKDIMKM